MEELVNQTMFPSEMVAKIEGMGTVAVSIANRWTTGWPARVKALLEAGTFLLHLEAQAEQEREVLANESNLRHLARHEILKMYEINEAPPAV